MCQSCFPCLCFKWECCKKYFPEWYNDRICKQFWCRMIIVILLALLIEAGVILLDQYVFDTGSTITWDTIVSLTLFFLGLSWLLVLYVEWQHVMYHWCVKLWIILIYLALGGYLIITELIGQSGEFEADTTCADIWTLVHFLAGPFFACLLPHWWMLIVVTLWEILETYTTGLGDEEILCNRILDIIVAVVGWWIVVLIFIRKYIPWISSKNAYDEWVKENPQNDHAGYEQSAASDLDNVESASEDQHAV